MHGEQWKTSIADAVSNKDWGDSFNLQGENDPELWSNERVDATAKSGPAGMRLVRLKAVTGPGDDGEPVMTFMLPEED